MLAGIREIAIIRSPADEARFQNLLGNGEQWGPSLRYIRQPAPDEVAQAYPLAEWFLDGAPSAMAPGESMLFSQTFWHCRNRRGR